jgi:hypothetical protein
LKRRSLSADRLTAFAVCCSAKRSEATLRSPDALRGDITQISQIMKKKGTVLPVLPLVPNLSIGNARVLETPFPVPCLTKQSFADKGIPNQEIGNEERRKESRTWSSSIGRFLNCVNLRNLRTPTPSSSQSTPPRRSPARQKPRGRRWSGRC